jgi:adenosylmethionine-8-amino-7-oxononanoate aminotransferase
VDSPPSLIARDLEVHWHPCGQQRDFQVFPPLAVVAASGCRLHLADGREILDAISSWWCKSLGHGHPRLRAALIAQAERFEHVIIANTTSAPLVRLCERLCAAANGRGPEDWGAPAADPAATAASAPAAAAAAAAPAGRAPGHFAKVFFADSGSSAVEVALKMALQAQAQSGRSRRTRFAALSGGYHGETVGALSVGDCGLYKDTFAPLLFPCLQLGPLPLRSGPEDPRWMDAAGAWPAIERQLGSAADTLAAIIYEPVLQGAGGMRLHSPDLLRRLRAWADAHQVLLIADEILSGWGRCGTMLSSHLAAARPPAAGGMAGLPDIAVIAKGLTGGVLPQAAVLTTGPLFQAFDAAWGEGKAFLHSSTHGGNALAVAVANAVLEAYAAEGVLAGVALRGPLLRRGLAELAQQRPYLGAVRGLGMMAAVDLQAPGGGPLPAASRTGWRIFRRAVERGALLRPLGDTLYLLPPLNAAASDLERMVAILADSCQDVLG